MSECQTSNSKEAFNYTQPKKMLDLSLRTMNYRKQSGSHRADS